MEHFREVLSQRIAKEAEDKSHIPERRLMVAVLEEALITFQSGLLSEHPVRRRRFCEVEQWIASRDMEWLFSFEHICASLGIDPSYVRAGLRRLKKAARKSGVAPRLRARRELISNRRDWRGRVG